MPRLRRFSSRQLIRALHGFGFDVESMKGSHAKFVRETDEGRREVLIAPVTDPLAIGTISAIYRQASRFIPQEDLRAAFFTD